MGSEASKAIHRFDRFTLDLVRGALFGDEGAEIPLRPKSFALLRHLVENAGRLVDRDEIMQAIWPGIFVTDDSIGQCVKEIRRALADDGQRLLRTLPRRGYLLAVPVPRADAAGLVLPTAATTSAASMASEQVPRPPTGRPMVVVLPFENIGRDPEQTYFSDGLTADLVTDLTRFQSLHVVSPLGRAGRGGRTLPATPWSGEEPMPRAAGFVVSGSVRQAGGRIRVTAQLEDAQSGVNLWAERFDRPLDDFFAVQEELANAIAACLAAHVEHEELRRARRRPPANLDAHDLCLRGAELHRAGTRAGTLAAREMFDRAIAADPEYGPAQAWQAYTVQRAYTHGWGEPQGQAALDAALALARRAVALEPESSLCLVRLAFLLLLHEGRGAEALETGRAAVHTNPCDFESRFSFGEILTHAGDPEEAVAELRLALALNPFSPPTVRAALGRALLLAGRPEEALPELSWCAARLPDYGPCQASLVVACAETGRPDEARAALREVERLRPGWRHRNFSGLWFFHSEAAAERFRRAFGAAGQPVA